jgi:ABC-type phosphate/phosphonate transport system substrate-binding protein
MIAALPMYDWPEERAAVDGWYATLRAEVPELPPSLTRDADPRALWRDPGLAFAQCCWGPLRQGLLAHLRVLAQPDYGDVPGGRGPFYRSALVARDAAPAPVPASPGAVLPPRAGRFAFNARDSLSGWIALAEDAGDPAGWAAALVETGSHRASVRAVAEGRADLAAIDARSWALARAHEPCAAGLAVVGWTAERPGLPFVTAHATPPALVAALRVALIRMGCHPATEGA